MAQSVFSWSFLSVSKYFLALFDIWAKNRIFEPRTGFSKILKKPQNMFSWCFLSFKVFLSLFHIWAENRMFEPRTGFSQISLKASKHVLLVFSGCFNVFFLALVDIWAENRIFEPRTRFSRNSWKASKHVGVFWVFHVFFSIVRHLSREPDFWAENSIFKTFFKSL